MKVSVIIPVYNVSQYIERCLLSVLNQTWQDLEIILVNDCTPDDSIEIAERVSISHSRGKIIKFLEHRKNRGLSAARNTGIFEAIGEYLYFLDSDDYLPLDSIASLAEAAISSKSDFIIGNYKVVGADRWAPPLLSSTSIIEGSENILSAYVYDKWYVMAWNKLIERSFLLQKNLFFQEGIVHEDDLWSFKLACIANKMSIVNKVTYYYYMQPNSIMRAPSLRNLECRVAIIGYFYDFIIQSDYLREKKLVYIFFERSKARYFDRILYFTKDTDFHFQSYLLFRSKKYLSPLRALFHFYPGSKQIVLNFHYWLPASIGYFYYKGIIKALYYCKILQIKVKRIFMKK